MGFYLNVFFSVAATPTCTVDKRYAAVSERVMFACFATSVCGSVSLMIENNGGTVAVAGNTVTWTTQVGIVVNSIVTCMSLIQCPSVTVAGELTAFYRTMHYVLSKSSVRPSARL